MIFIMNKNELSVYSESLNSSFNGELSNEPNSSTNKCHICGKSYFFRFKKTCKFCDKTICSEHSKKKRIKSGFSDPQRICVVCDEKMILKEINQEIDQDIEKLSKEIIDKKIVLIKESEEIANNNKAIDLLQEEIRTQEELLKKTDEDLALKFKNEIDKGGLIRESIEVIRKILDNYIENERLLVTESSKKESELSEYLETEENLIRANSNLTTEIQNSYKLLKKSIPKSEIEKLLCSNCLNLI